MFLINCETNLILTWFPNWVNWVVINSTSYEKIAITDTKLYFMIVTLLNKDNAKLLQQLKPKSEFKQIIIWHRFQSNRTAQTQSQYQNCLIDPSFQEVKRPPAEDLFEDNEHSIKHTG